MTDAQDSTSLKRRRFRELLQRQRLTVMPGGFSPLYARLAQEAGFDVTIYTKAMPPETTSNIAGGQWLPVTVYDTDRTLTPEFTEQFKAAAQYGYRRYQIMTDPKYGIRWMRNYQLSDTPWHSPSKTTQNGLLQGLLPEAKDLPAGTHSFGNKFVRQFDGMLVEPPIYLPAMLTDVRIAGGKVVVRELKNLIERIVILNPQVRIDARHIPLQTTRRSSADRATERFASLQEVRETAEREYILKKLEETNGNVTRTAELLGLERSNLYRKMKTLGIAVKEQ